MSCSGPEFSRLPLAMRRTRLRARRFSSSARPVTRSGEGAKNAVGPVLNGLFGRKAGSIEGFSYSPANKNSGITWDEATFREYIRDPKAKIPGTKMIFPGLKDPKQIDDIVAYLKQFDAAGKKAGIAPAGRKLAKVQ